MFRARGRAQQSTQTLRSPRARACVRSPSSLALCHRGGNLSHVSAAYQRAHIECSRLDQTATIRTFRPRDVAPDCSKAFNLLDQTTIDGKKKSASDPAFNMAAQLLAAKLNVVAEAGSCTAANDAIAAGQALLDAVPFNGLTHTKLTAAQTTQANALATTLDRYNNGLLC